MTYKNTNGVALTRVDRYGNDPIRGGTNSDNIRAAAVVSTLDNITIQNINGITITNALYMFPQSVEIFTRTTDLSGTITGRYWSNEVPTTNEVKQAYINIKNAVTTDEKVKAINTRITQILRHVNALGAELMKRGIEAENKEFWETAAPFLVNVFFGGVGAALGGSVGFGVGLKLGNMITGYSEKQTAVYNAEIALKVKTDIGALDTEAKALTAEITRIDADYANKDKFYADLLAEVKSRSANLTNSIYWIIGGVALLLFIKKRKKK